MADGSSPPFSLFNSNVYFDPLTRKMSVNSDDPDHYGIYYANIRITLDEYPNG